MRREKVDTNPPFSRVTWRFSVDSGESGDSSPGLGFDAKGKIAVMSANPERFEGEISGYHQIRDQGLKWASSSPGNPRLLGREKLV
jgi:hypothetical protein